MRKFISKTLCLTEVPPIVHLVGPGDLECVGNSIFFQARGEQCLKFDPTHVKAILLYGDVRVAARSISRLSRTSATLSFLSEGGRRFRGRISHDHDGTTQFKKKQIRLLNDESIALRIAKHLVLEKLESILAAQKRMRRSGLGSVSGAEAAVRQAKGKVNAAEGRNQLFGIEGRASRRWFEVVRKRLPSEWEFMSRRSRPPVGPVNALLSFGYTLLHERLLAKILGCGLEPGWGALHALTPGRASLACDLMEPLRVPFVDRWVLATCRQRVISPKDFEAAHSGGTKIRRPTMSRVIASFERHGERHGFEQALSNQISEFWTWIEEPSGDPTSAAAVSS